MKRLAIAVALILSAAAARAEDAASLYQSKCKMCHGSDGKGTPTGLKMGAKDFSALKLSASDATKVIADGKGKMPGYKGKLTDAQITALGQYVANGLK